MSIKESNTKKNYSNSYKKAGNIKVADASSYKRDIGVLVNKVRKKYNMNSDCTENLEIISFLWKEC